MNSGQNQKRTRRRKTRSVITPAFLVVVHGQDRRPWPWPSQGQKRLLRRIDAVSATTAVLTAQRSIATGYKR